MTRTMYDSTSAADIPQGAEMVAGYVDGVYAWSAADWARFPTAVKVSIATQAATDAGEVLDCEMGDATVAEVPGWVRMRMAAGLARPTVYCARFAMGQVQAAVAGLPVDLWVADWTGVPHAIDGAVAVQYANDSSSGGHYDLSIVTDDSWPHGDPPPAEVIDMTMDLARLFVWEWYVNWCGRVASVAEVDEWAVQLSAPGASYLAVADAFYGSPEPTAYRSKTT